MEIGSKIKQARNRANLTQEQAADALGVSRQTISNWENEKTYPDIISVVKMSDLYHISLDHLLKGEQSSPTYLEYLEASTNTVKSKEQLSKLILIATYLGIWAFSLVSFWFFNSGSDALGYSIMYLWLLLPITTFVLSWLIGKNNHWGGRKWIGAVAFGFMYMLAEYATFQAANMVTFGKCNLPSFEMLPVGALISLAGLGMGSGVRKLQQKRKQTS